MDIFQNQCSESLGFDSMLSSNQLNSPLHDSPGSPNPLSFAPSSPYFSSISQQLCVAGAGGSTSGPNDVILPSIFVKIPTQINQQYQQENRLQNARNSNEIKCEERAEPIKSEVADTRAKLTVANIAEQLPDIIDNYLNDTRAANGPVDQPSIRRCEYCPFATLSEASLDEHKRTKHASGVRIIVDTLACPVCENKFFKKPVLELHLLEDHEMTRTEMEMLCSRIASCNSVCSQSITVSSSAQTCSTVTTSFASMAAPNKSRIYIKDVQLLKNPDVIAQETQHENDQQCQAQQMLPIQQQPSLPPAHLCAPENQLPPSDTSSDNQYQGGHHEAPLPGVNCSASGSKIFIRNVSLLQNANFTPSAENILLSNGGKYHSFMNHECESLSPALDTASMDDSYCQMLSPSVATQPRGNRIYIKNVDILRNPLLSLEPPSGGSSSYNVTTSSRASSCESIICTSTPPPSAPQPSASQTLQPIVQTSIIPLSQILPSQTQLAATPGDQSLPGDGCNGSLRSSVNGGMLGLGGLMTPQPQQSQTIGQGTVSLPMMYATMPDHSGLAGSLTQSTVSSCMSVLPVTSTACTDMNLSTNGYQAPSFASDGQRKSKIFIKNISVLKQPTIHLKSVDEVNLMTYDQLQLQNLLPASVGVTSVGGSLNPINNHLEGERAQENSGRNETMATDQIDQSFGVLMEGGNVNHHVQQEQQEEAMDGYHDVGCYGDLDVCDFTDGFNDRDDPGGGVGDAAISVPSGGSDNNTLSMSCDGILGEARCDNFQSGFDQDIILLQPNTSDESQANEAQKMSENWASIQIAGGALLSQDILASSESISGQEGTMDAQYHDDGGEQQQNKDVVFVCAQEVINLDPANEEAKVGEEMQRDTTDVEETVTLATDEPATLENDLVSERPRPRGRPKGAKQTGITKLKKLYSNLTPQEEGYKCDIKDCGARFRQQERLDYHRKCHLGTVDSEPSNGPPAIQCPECGSLEFRNWNTLHTHLWREHSVDMELYSCQLCSFKTPVLCRLTNTHMKIHSEERNFKCAVCSKAFKNNKQLRNHRRSHRDPAQVPPAPQQQTAALEESHSTTDGQRASRDQMEVDNVPSESVTSAKCSKAKPPALAVPIKCVKCGQKFTSQRQLHAHMTTKHPAIEEGVASETPGKHHCALCGMMFKTRYLLQSHLAKHSDEKRFKCEHCDYMTNDHNAFRRHKMRHNTKGSHMYKCSYCDYTSIQSTTYRKHLERMHADEASRLLYKCGKCPFVSISELKYQLHRAKHENPGNVADVAEELLDDPTPEDTRRPEEQMSFEGEFPITEADAGQHLSQQNTQQEDDTRACESVGSDVMIVENRETTEETTVDLNRPTCGDQFPIQQRSASALQFAQQPIIRPAMFANNFSKVDNFYGHQHQNQWQPKILKLTDRIPSHRVSPLGQQLQTVQPSVVPTVTLPGSVVPPAAGIISQHVERVDFPMESFDVHQQHQEQYGHQQALPNVVGDPNVATLGRN